MRVYVGLIMLARVLSPGFLVSYWSAEFLQVSVLASHWLEYCASQRQKKTTNTAPTPLSAIQAARQSTFINENYTTLVVRGND